MQDSSVGRLIGVLVSPKKTFEAIAAKPSWAIAFVVFVLALLVVGALLSGRVDYEQMVRDSLEQQGRQLGEDQVQQAIDVGEKVIPFMISLSGPIFGGLGCLLFGLVFMVAFRVLGGELGYVKSMAVVSHGMMPQVVGSLLAIPIVLGREEFTLAELQGGKIMASNAATFLGEDAGRGLVALASSLDIFTFWTLALMVIGFTAIARVSRGTSIGVVIGLWIVYVLGKTGIAALGG